METYIGILIPFFGTALGSACVLFMHGAMNKSVQKSLAGFAAGVMFAASIWSLIVPAIDKASHLGKLSFIPALIGVWLGVLFLLLLDHAIPHLHVNATEPEGPKTNLKKTTTMVLAVALHNIPEGMAIGVVYAGLLAGDSSITVMSALALSIGIAIQNFPEGAIISLPLRAEGMSNQKSCLYGILSGIVEPLGALITLQFTGLIVPALPYLLCFAAGAMLYVVVEELIPTAVEGSHNHIGTFMFTAGFSVMMVLDVALG